ncbi:transcription cofactor vestigial 4 [Solea senegalensis]|uniref:Transcription cofactor vestigial 4 n=1 Tax=Solea senegalensis TaxID=28829 RepID=A0AAV6QE19_SOLSE|nr:vestigial like 4 like [Solea senegalensis]KAG7489731.1 transcription cofactor vestigial 4 [Solea senegalensis]
MAVANFHYITRMSSGFKVYILEGQPHLRSEDRYRHITNDRVRAPTVYPVKRKRSHERGLTLEERRERVLARSSGKVAQRTAPAPPVFTNPQSPTSTWNSAHTPTASPLPTHVYYTPVMDEPLALIKKPRKDPENTEKSTSSGAATQIQMRPSVITCVSSVRNPSSRPEVHRSHTSVVSSSSYDHGVEEHFQRSLGVNYQKAHSQQLSISVSVDDHFAKALGDKWLQIKSKSSSCSSTPPSSPSVTHSPSHSHSPNQSHKESASGSSPSSSHWSIN